MHLDLRSPNRLLLAALALGLGADRLFFGRWPGVSAPLFVGAGLALLLILGHAEGRPPTRANLWQGAAALVFASFMAVRDNGLLGMLNGLACAGLLLLAAGGWRDVALHRLPGWQYAARALTALGELSLRPLALALHSVRSLPVSGERASALAPVGRGLALALPVVGVFTLLLMAADSVFASYVNQLTSFDLPFNVPELVAHGVMTLGAAWVCAGGMLTALRAVPAERVAELPAEGDTRPLEPVRHARGLLGGVEALTVLGAVDALFASFLLIQGAYFFGGLDTLERTGMTYSEYARRGFFELLAVAVLTLGLLWLLAQITRRPLPGQRRAFNAASGAMIVLVLGLLASAFQRMWLYEQAYGYTHLRIYTHSFMIWLALLLALFLAALLRDEPRMFSFGGFVSALAYLAALNLANPDALIAQLNIARYQAAGGMFAEEPWAEAWIEAGERDGARRGVVPLDARYLAGLSADATPTLIAALPTLDPQSREVIIDGLARQRVWLEWIEDSSGWPAWNAARAQALWALDGAGIEPRMR